MKGVGSMRRATLRGGRVLRGGTVSVWVDESDVVVDNDDCNVNDDDFGELKADAVRGSVIARRAVRSFMV